MSFDFILSGDPYEGARVAFLAINPDTTDQDWEDWAKQYYLQSEGQFDNFDAFADLCRRVQARAQLSDRNRRLIDFATGYFEAMHIMASGLISAVPASIYMACHFERSRSKLMTPSEI